jgi:hypothetical protein
VVSSGNSSHRHRHDIGHPDRATGLVTMNRPISRTALGNDADRQVTVNHHHAGIMTVYHFLYDIHQIASGEILVTSVVIRSLAKMSTSMSTSLICCKI